MQPAAMQKHRSDEPPVLAALEESRNDGAQPDHGGIAGIGLRHDFVSENDRNDGEQSGRDRREPFHPFSSTADMRRKIACAIRGENSFKRMNSAAANGRTRR